MPVARRAIPGPFKIAVVLFGGATIGLLATAWMLEHRIDPAAIRIGPWVTWPRSGTTEIDPYARAIFAQNAMTPLAAAQGVSFSASRDDRGAALSARCGYRFEGPLPPTRFWTLSATTPAGRPMDNAAAREGFSSRDIVRRDGGGFSIVVGPRARPGNWLPVSGEGAFVLTLRLYETPLASTAGGIVKLAMPSLVPLGCAP